MQLCVMVDVVSMIKGRWGRFTEWYRGCHTIIRNSNSEAANCIYVLNTTQAPLAGAQKGLCHIIQSHIMDEGYDCQGIGPAYDVIWVSEPSTIYMMAYTCTWLQSSMRYLERKAKQHNTTQQKDKATQHNFPMERDMYVYSCVHRSIYM